MVRAAKLKVYRMPIGFHDAYVAAPSQKAAIEAWGADADVFRRGWAELVEDPALTEEPLARPGEVVKRLRGSEAEQLAALAADEPRSGKKSAPKPKPKPKPRPSREPLGAAEAALVESGKRHEAEREALREREAALARERAALEARQRQERARLEQRRDAARAAYEAKMERWRAE